MRALFFQELLGATDWLRVSDSGSADALLKSGAVVALRMQKAAQVRDCLKEVDPVDPAVRGKRDALKSLMNVTQKRLDEAERQHEALLRMLPGCAEPLP